MDALSKERICKSVISICRGDTVVIQDKRGNRFIHTVKEVLHKGSGKEEVLLKRKKNVYFIWAMYLEGDSWVKYVWLLADVKNG